jgi:hypothetical protein
MGAENIDNLAGGVTDAGPRSLDDNDMSLRGGASHSGWSVGPSSGVSLGDGATLDESPSWPLRASELRETSRRNLRRTHSNTPSVTEAGRCKCWFSPGPKAVPKRDRADPRKGLCSPITATCYPCRIEIAAAQSLRTTSTTALSSPANGPGGVRPSGSSAYPCRTDRPCCPCAKTPPTIHGRS